MVLASTLLRQQRRAFASIAESADAYRGAEDGRYSVAQAYMADSDGDKTSKIVTPPVLLLGHYVPCWCPGQCPL